MIPVSTERAAPVIMNDRYRWKQGRVGAWTIYRAGSAVAPGLLLGMESTGGVNPEALGRALHAEPGPFGYVAESSRYIVAAVDKIRSYPVFYARDEKGPVVSNSARDLQSCLRLSLVDEESFLEFSMTCYVTGRDTLYQGLKQLLPGERLLWDKASKDFMLHRYYIYFDSDEDRADETEWVKRLASMTDDIFRDVVARAGNRPVWVPLSGGWDSRLVVAKLKELGCANLRAFSYGTPGNHESRLAAKVARVLDVPWFQFDVRGKDFRRCYWSSMRQDYFRYADGLCSLPFIQDVHVLYWLKESGRLPEDAVIINGQSGDFISGGHIGQLQAETELDQRSVEEYLLSHHYIMWKNLLNTENTSLVRGKIQKVLGEILSAAPGMAPGHKMLECWEWQERQSKFVVNGQRAYDFLKIDWELPLWDDRYLFFWAQVPRELKVGQRLYKEYLRRTGYRNVFRIVSTYVWRWPGASIVVVPLARAVGLVLGEQTKDKTYKLLKCFGHGRAQYAAFGYLSSMREAQWIRDPDSLHLRTWCRENHRWWS